MARVVPSDTPNRAEVDLNDPQIVLNYRTASKAQATFRARVQANLRRQGQVWDDIEDDEGGDLYTVTSVVNDEGTIVQFAGTDAEGNPVTVAADHRMAQAIADAIAEDGYAEVSAPSYMVTRGITSARKQANDMNSQGEGFTDWLQQAEQELARRAGGALVLKDWPDGYWDASFEVGQDPVFAVEEALEMMERIDQGQNRDTIMGPFRSSRKQTYSPTHGGK
jgi:hypothetical protein